uniref:Uncharacterized protein n=1 Tax=Oryza meridionalis TaxID=40149 RepID=A0A0E0CKD0_9ORYZ
MATVRWIRHPEEDLVPWWPDRTRTRPVAAVVVRSSRWRWQAGRQRRRSAWGPRREEARRCSTDGGCVGRQGTGSGSDGVGCGVRRLGRWRQWWCRRSVVVRSVEVVTGAAIGYKVQSVVVGRGWPARGAGAALPFCRQGLDGSGASVRQQGIS